MNPVVAVPYVSMSDADIAALNLSAVEMTTLNTLNASNKGFLEKRFFEDKSNGNLYFTEASIPAGAEVTEATYTILNMFGSHS